MAFFAPRQLVVVALHLNRGGVGARDQLQDCIVVDGFACMRTAATSVFTFKSPFGLPFYQDRLETNTGKVGKGAA